MYKLYLKRKGRSTWQNQEWFKIRCRWTFFYTQLFNVQLSCLPSNQAVLQVFLFWNENKDLNQWAVMPWHWISSCIFNDYLNTSVNKIFFEQIMTYHHILFTPSVLKQLCLIEMVSYSNKNPKQFDQGNFMQY